MVGPFKWQPAAPLVGDGEHAVDMREIPSPGPVAELVRDVAGSAGRTIHRADHGDIVPRPDPAVGAQIALKSPLAVGPRRLRVFRCERIVTLEEIGLQVMYVYQRAGGY